MLYLVVHILDVEGGCGSTRYPFHPEIEPGSIVVLWMVSTNPDVVLHKARVTAAEEAFSTKERFPESNSELNRTGPI